MTDRKKPGVAFWATVVVAVVLAYPLSMFPVAWLDSRDLLSEDSIHGKALWIYCAPIRWANEYGPEWIGKSLQWITDVSGPADG